MRNSDESLDMWEYWREDKGLECAAAEYYPKLFASDPVLSKAMGQIKWAEHLIETRMQYLLEQSQTKP